MSWKIKIGWVMAVLLLLVGVMPVSAQSYTWGTPHVTNYVWQSTNYDPGTDYLWTLFNCQAWQAHGMDDENTAAVFGLPAGTVVAGIKFKSFASSGSGPTTVYHSTLWLRDTHPNVLTPDGRVLETALYRGDNDDPHNPGFTADGVQANRDFPPFGTATVTVTDPKTGISTSTVQAGGINGWKWDMGWQVWTPVQIVFSQPHVMSGHLRFENLDIGSFNVVGNYGVKLLMPTTVRRDC